MAETTKTNTRRTVSKRRRPKRDERVEVIMPPSLKDALVKTANAKRLPIRVYVRLLVEEAVKENATS